MNKYQNQTPSPVSRHHHTTSSSSSSSSHLPLPHPHPHPVALHHAAHQLSTHHQHKHTQQQQQQQQHQHYHHLQHHHHTPSPPLQHSHPLQQQPLPPPPLPPLPPSSQPLISNSLAIRQEIQRFESVHPSIYAIYDLIDLLPISDAQIAQQIRDHVVCIEASIAPDARGLILNSQAKKAVRNLMKQMPCGWPEHGIPPLAPYTNADLRLQFAKSFLDVWSQLLRFRLDGLDQMIIKKMKVSFTFKKKVKYHFIFKTLKATATSLNTDTFMNLMNELGLSVRYEGSGPMEFTLRNLEIEGQFKYKMPILWGSIKIYKFQSTVRLGGVSSNIGGILGNGGLNRLINDELEYQIPNYINSHQNKISAIIEETVVPRVNAKLKGKKIWYILGKLGSSSGDCESTPAPWLAQIQNDVTTNGKGSV